MPVPKRRTSSAKRDRRRAHDALAAPALAKCANCGAVVSPHRVCPACGHYRGRQVIAVSDTEE
jgi:large subunit ribosomal protein L32